MENETRKPKMEIGIVEPGYEIIPMPDGNDKMAVLKHIERIGRTCYKSEERITDESCVKFVQMLRDKQHWAMLEHFNFVLSVPTWIGEDINRLYNIQLFNNSQDEYYPCHWNAAYDEFITRLKYITVTVDREGQALISGSATAFNNVWQCDYVRDFQMNNFSIDHGVALIYENKAHAAPLEALMAVLSYLRHEYPELIVDGGMAISNDGHKSFEMPKCDLFDTFGRKEEQEIKVLSEEEISQLPQCIRRVHQTMSVRFICDRGISHEIVRHRPASYAQESTRYVNYSSRGYQIIVPPDIRKSTSSSLKEWNEGMAMILEAIQSDSPEFNCVSMKPFTETPSQAVTDDGEKSGLYCWIVSVITALLGYDRMLRGGNAPQIARNLLPHCIKTEIVMTARLCEWEHFFKMRADKAAHPQMQQLAYPLLEEAKQKYPGIFH